MKFLLAALAFMVFAATAYAAPQQQIPVSPRPELIVLMNTDTAYQLPTTPSWEMGHIIKVFDNTGAAGGATITISGKCAAGTSTITSNYGSATFTWTGACWQ